MTSQEQSNHQAPGGQPGHESLDQADAPGTEDQSVIPFDYIDEAIEETMVASDPPALTPDTGIGPPDRDAGAGVDPDRR